MDFKERGSHAGVYPTQDASCMGRVSVLQKEEKDARVIKYRGKKRGTKEKSPKQDLTSAKDLTIELNEGRESPYHRLDLINLNYSLIYGS